MDEPIRKRFLTPSTVALIVANLVPLYGVLAAGWRIFPLILLYWLENGVIGSFGVLKILLVGPALPKQIRLEKPYLLALTVVIKIVFALFFVAHFSCFMAGHGFFIVMMFGGEGLGLGGDIDPGKAIEDALRVLSDPGFIAAALAMLFSHGWSFVVNYLKGRERERANLNRLMGAPYKRVIVLHVFIIASGFLVMALGSPIPALLLFVALKTAVDLIAHLREHRKARAQAKPVGPPPDGKEDIP